MKRLTLSLLLLTLCLSTETTSIEINTGNILVNPGFTGGNTSWTNHGTTQQHHTYYGNECNPNTANNFSTTCGVTKGSLAGVDDGGVSQTVTLSEDTNMGTPEIQRGFTSTMSSDIWFWHGEDKVTMTQTLTDSSGDVNTQIRIVEDDHNIYKTYTDSITIGANTSTDFDINARIDIDDSSNSSSHAGPDVDNVELSITYNTSDGDELDWEEDFNIPEDIEWEEDWTWEEEEFTWEDDFYFEEEFDVEDYNVGTEFEEPPLMIEEEFEEPPPMEEETVAMPEEEFEEMYMEEFEDMEEAFMDAPEEFEEPPLMEEEETIDMEMEEEEDVVEMEGEDETEEMEVAEDEESMEDTEGSDDEPETEVAEEPEPEDGPQEVAANEEEAVGEDNIEAGEVEDNKITVSKEIKVGKVDVGEIKVAINPRDIFKEVISLNDYSNRDFYTDKGLNYATNDDFFEQLSMIEYNKEIYKGVTLVLYIQGDPVEVYRQELEELAIQKAGIMIELKLLRGE